MTRTGAWLVEVALPPMAFFAVAVVAWQSATMFWDIPAYLVPRPEQVAVAAHEHAPDLVAAARLTASAALGGFGLSLLAGTALGLVFSQSRAIQRSVYPYAIFLQTVPIVAIAPLVIMWFGYGLSGVIAVSFILSLFPIVTNATAGLTSVDPNLLELFAVYNASRRQVLFELRLPNAVPYLVAGSKISCGLSVIGAIVGEIYAGFGTQNLGLGTLITMATRNLDTAYAFAAVFASTLLGIAIFAAVSLIGTTILSRWHTTVPRNSTIQV